MSDSVFSPILDVSISGSVWYRSSRISEWVPTYAIVEFCCLCWLPWTTAATAVPSQEPSHCPQSCSHTSYFPPVVQSYGHSSPQFFAVILVYSSCRHSGTPPPPSRSHKVSNVLLENTEEPRLSKRNDVKFHCVAHWQEWIFLKYLNFFLSRSLQASAHPVRTKCSVLKLLL
jgi:hypothetical protein